MNPGNIILLNGIASADKTRIVQALYEVLDTPYLYLSIDQFSSSLSPVDQGYPLWAKVQEPPATVPGLGRAVQPSRQPIAGLHQAVAALARAGNHVIVDHQLLHPDWLRACIQALADLPVWFIGVRCPLDTLVAQGNAILAQAQAATVHAPGVYDLEVDTAHLSPLACAMQIKQHLQAGPPPTAMHWLKAWSDPAKQRGWIRR